VLQQVVVGGKLIFLNSALRFLPFQSYSSTFQMSNPGRNQAEEFNSWEQQIRDEFIKSSQQKWAEN